MEPKMTAKGRVNILSASCSLAAFPLWLKSGVRGVEYRSFQAQGVGTFVQCPTVAEVGSLRMAVPRVMHRHNRPTIPLGSFRSRFSVRVVTS
jgi:hypothetical protein